MEQKSSGFVGARARAAALLRERRRAMKGQQAERGQAMVFALIVVVVATVLPTLLITNLQHTMPTVQSEVNFDGALAAAQAGVQSYRNLLNAYPAYYQYNASNAASIPPGEGGPNAAFTGWVNIPNTSPTESFTYSADATQLSGVNGGPLSGDVLLTVLGRGGTAGEQTSYRRIQAALSLSGVLTDVYYSNYEQPGLVDTDQWDQNVYPRGSASNPCTPTSPTCSAEAYDEITATLSYAPVGSSTPSVATLSEPAATALCLYDASQPNQFIDWYSQYVSSIYPPSGGGYPNGSSAYNTTTRPYYGPWYGTFPDPLNGNAQFGASGNPNGGACNVNYWITGDTFNGPVYSQDELTTCGQPTFTGSPSLQTAVSKTFDFPANWPGTLTSGGFGHPYGYVRDPFSSCGGPDTPTFTDPLSPRFSVDQSLPPLATELKTEIETGQIAGCIYTGPTAIRFYWNPSSQSEQMVVWSPLTQVTYAPSGTNCGSWPTTQPSGSTNPGDPLQVTGAAPGTVQSSQSVLQVVPVTQPIVIYVQNTPTWNSSLGGYQSQDPNAWQTLPTPESVANGAAVANCIDPFVNSGPGGSVNATTCDEGDTMLSGTLGHGQSSGGELTIASEASNVISHSIVYDCALSGSGNWPGYSNSISGCANSLDILGLVANNNTWLAHPVDASGRQLAACTDDYDMPAPGDNPSFGTTPPVPTVPGRAPADLLADQGDIDFNDMIPTLCDQNNPILDGAEASLQGFFEVQNWREGNASGGTLYFNGSTAVNDAGQYGVFSSGPSLQNGYLLNLTYDTRLRYLVPPSFVQATASVWSVVDWTSCGNSNYAAPGTAAVAVCIALPT
jgi:Tfp pilus assembly protein PilX